MKQLIHGVIKLTDTKCVILIHRPWLSDDWQGDHQEAFGRARTVTDYQS